MDRQIVNVNINDIIPYVNNARTHSDEQIIQLRSSLREFGFVNPILIDSDYGLIAGHGRLTAAKLENYQTVPCVIIDGLTDTQKKAYILADNRLAEKAGWDMELVNIELQELSDMDFDIELTGFDFNIENDDIEPIDDENISTSANTEHFMSIDKTKITLTEEEFIDLQNSLNRYVELNGVSFGFVRSILNG